MNTPHETVDSIERSAYDSAMSGEVKEKWEEEFDKICPPARWNKGIQSREYLSIPLEAIEFINNRESFIRFIRTQRSLAQQEILDRVINLSKEHSLVYRKIGEQSEQEYNQLKADIAYAKKQAIDDFRIVSLVLLSTLKDTNI